MWLVPNWFVLSVLSEKEQTLGGAVGPMACAQR